MSKNIVINEDHFVDIIKRHEQRIATLERGNAALKRQIPLRVNAEQYTFEKAPGDFGFKFDGGAQ